MWTLNPKSTGADNVLLMMGGLRPRTIKSRIANQITSCLDASLFARSATVVRNWRAILNRLDIQARSLECSDRTLAPTSRSFNANVDFFDAEFDCFFCSLLSRTLASKRSTLTTPFEPTCSSTCPTKGFALGVSDSNGCVVKRSLDVCNAISHIATHSPLFCLCHFLFSSVLPAVADSDFRLNCVDRSDG